MLHKFRRYVEDALKNTNLSGLNCLGIAKHLGYKFKSPTSNSAIEVADFIYTEIQNALSGKGFDSSKFEYLRKQCTVDAFLYGDLLNKRCFQIITIIRDASRELTEYTSDHSSWKKAIALVQAYLALNRYDPLNNMNIVHAKEKAIAEALIFFKGKGFKVELKDGKPNIIDEGRIIKAIDHRIKQLGIRAFLNVRHNLRQHYNPKQDRYSLRRISNVPLIPWGYLLKLSVKYLDSNLLQVQNERKRWNETVEMAGHYCALFELQEFSEFEIINQNPQSILKTIQRMVLFDQVYSIEQIARQHITELIKGLFLNVDFAGLNLPWDVKDYIAVMDGIIECGKEDNPSTVNADLIVGKIGNQVSRNSILDILDFLGENPRNINRGFIHPSDNAKKNYSYKPLIRINDKNFFLGDLPLFNFGFYEVLSSTLRNAGLKEEKIGELLEKYIKEKFDNSNIPCRFAEKYKITKTQQKELETTRDQGECDFILETDDTIIFIEIKKKILTREAQSGNVLKIVVDIIKSFLNAQIQANWHELMLRKYGSIKFSSGTELHLNNRRIEKLSFSMLDYQCLHDGFLLHQIIQNLINCELKADTQDKAVTEDLAEINKTLKELNKQYNMPEFSIYHGNLPFLNCRFYNLFQFMEIMQDVNSVSGFKNAIWSTRHVTSGEKDWFKEYNYFKSIRANQKNSTP